MSETVLRSEKVLFNEYQTVDDTVPPITIAESDDYFNDVNHAPTEHAQPWSDSYANPNNSNVLNPTPEQENYPARAESMTYMN
jgi:hypothetical protein